MLTLEPVKDADGPFQTYVRLLVLFAVKLRVGVAQVMALDPFVLVTVKPGPICELPIKLSRPAKRRKDFFIMGVF